VVFWVMGRYRDFPIWQGCSGLCQSWDYFTRAHRKQRGDFDELRKGDTPATVDDIAGLFQHINLMQRTLLSIGAIALRSAQSPKEIEQIDAQVQAMVDDFTNRVTALAKRLDIDVGDNWRVGRIWSRMRRTASPSIEQSARKALYLAAHRCSWKDKNLNRIREAQGRGDVDEGSDTNQWI